MCILRYSFALKIGLLSRTSRPISNFSGLIVNIGVLIIAVLTTKLAKMFFFFILCETWIKKIRTFGDIEIEKHKFHLV